MKICKISISNTQNISEKNQRDLKRRDILYSQAGRFSILKMLHLSKLIYRFNKIQISKSFFFEETYKLIPKFIWKYKLSKISKAIMKTEFNTVSLQDLL